MAGQLLLVNPRKRRRKARKARRRSRSRRRSSRRRSNPGFALPNPRKRRRSRRRSRSRGRARRRNPAPRLSFGGVQSQVMNAVPGAFGALGLDVLMGIVPFIPAAWKTGIPGYLVKAVGAVGLGMLANMSGLVKSGTASKMTEGALTVMLHGIMRGMTAQFAPMVPLGAYEQLESLGYAGAGLDPGFGDYDESGEEMSAYLPGMGGYDDTEGVFN